MPETPTTRWLDAEEQRVWRAYLAASQLLVHRLSRELDESGHDLAMPEYELLVRLSEAPGRALRMSDLAEGLVHSRSRLTHATARLEQRGLVERRACPEDRRGVLAVMTEEGRAALAAAAPVHVTGVREHLFDPLTAEDVAALGRISTKVAEHLREPADGGARSQPAQPVAVPKASPSR